MNKALLEHIDGDKKKLLSELTLDSRVNHHEGKAVYCLVALLGAYSRIRILQPSTKK